MKPKKKKVSNKKPLALKEKLQIQRGFLYLYERWKRGEIKFN